jgi:hypothetical protein
VARDAAGIVYELKSCESAAACQPVESNKIVTTAHHFRSSQLPYTLNHAVLLSAHQYLNFMNHCPKPLVLTQNPGCSACLS